MSVLYNPYMCTKDCLCHERREIMHLFIYIPSELIHWKSHFSGVVMLKLLP